ncbi:hypothetical protein ACFWDN_21395 [Micromonospora chalcea]
MTANPTGRGWAYFGAIVGGGLSIAANVEHSYIGDTAPPTLKVVFSVAWPVLLFIGIEVLARVAFPKGLGYALLRFVGVGSVALVAAIVSYEHMSGLFEHWGMDRVTVELGPLAIDGLLALCSVALILTGRKRSLAEVAEPVPAPPVAAPVPLYVPEAWSDPRETHQDAPVSPAPASGTPEPATAAVAPVVTLARVEECEAPEPTPEPEPEPTPEPTDLRMVTRLKFGPVPEVGDPERYPEIRRRADALKAEDPARSQVNIAVLIGVPRSTLRDALRATAPKPSSPPKLELVPTV